MESTQNLRALDARVAHCVMGWSISSLNSSPYNGGEHEIRGLRPPDEIGGITPDPPEWRVGYRVNEDLYGIPHYSSNTSDAFQVVEKMREDWIFTMELDGHGCRAGFGRGYADTPEEVSASADTAPLAICRAALRALGVEPGSDGKPVK